MVPPIDEVERWLDRFVVALPGAQHRAIAFDCPSGDVSDLAGFAERGFTVDVSTVMTATSVRLPPHPNPEATYRPLASDDDWAQSLALQIACHDGYEVDHLEFVTRRTESNQTLVADGHGKWFGAFVDGRLVTQMGLVRAGGGLARFQSVETHPVFRGRGLAGTLLHHVSGYGFAELGAETLVMVADPTYPAIRIYEAVGFTASESAPQAELFPLTA